MADNFIERRDKEQFLFTKDCINGMMNSIMEFFPERKDIEEKVCCMCVPSLAKAFWDVHGIKITSLEIDERFESLPGHTYFDIINPEPLGRKFDLIVFDPPFFATTLEKMCTAA